MPISELDWEGMDPPGPMTESSDEQGFEPDPEQDWKRGESEELDGDEAGDIADEGTAHRG